jgi:hypothetical protein
VTLHYLSNHPCYGTYPKVLANNAMVGVGVNDARALSTKYGNRRLFRPFAFLALFWFDGLARGAPKQMFVSKIASVHRAGAPFTFRCTS